VRHRIPPGGGEMPDPACGQKAALAVGQHGRHHAVGWRRRTSAARRGEKSVMQFGASMFFTDYSMTPAALGRALEERGFESVWAPEHSHIPVSRKTAWPGGGDLPKRYYDTMDPFVTLTAAAAATKALKIGTGVCLVNQRDPIQTAKLVASIDLVSGGRFLFGVGVGWNQDEMENHGTVFATRAKLTRERIEAMQQIWTKSKAEFHGQFVNFDPMMAWPKPVQKPHPPVIVGGAFPQGARRALRYGDGWMPITGRSPASGLGKMLEEFKQLAAEAGRDPATVPLSAFGAPDDLDLLRQQRDLGFSRAIVALDSEKEEKILPVLDRWADYIRRIGT
jgi:probable F420-dependent oxidoreductase